MSEDHRNAPEIPAWRRRTIAGIHGLLLCIIFFAVLIGTCALIHHWLPFPGIPVVTGKLAHWDAHADDYDTIFVGSSRVHEQISPAIFDAVAREHGVETHSFNFGIMGMFGPEDAFILRKILAKRPKNLRRMFIEVSSVVFNFAGEEPDALRTQYWHDAKTLSLLLGTSSTRKQRGFKWSRWRKDLPEKWTYWSYASKHMILFLREFANVGRGTLFTRRFYVRNSVSPSKELGPAGDGFYPFERTMQAEAAAEFRDQYSQRLTKPARERPLDPAAQRNFEDLLRLVRAAHAEPIFLLSPAPYPDKYVPRNKDGVLLLDFTDVHRWAPLFEEKHRMDNGHLNRQGAEIYSRLFAEEYFAKSAPRVNANDAHAPNR